MGVVPSALRQGLAPVLGCPTRTWARLAYEVGTAPQLASRALTKGCTSVFVPWVWVGGALLNAFLAGYLLGRRGVQAPSGPICVASGGGTAVLITAAPAQAEQLLPALTDLSRRPSSVSLNAQSAIPLEDAGALHHVDLTALDDSTARHLRVRGFRRGGGALA